MSDIRDSDEFKAAVAEAIAEEVKGLKAKNAELIEANKKLRKQTEIDPNDFSAMENERDELKGKLAEATKALGKAQKDVEAATKRAADIDSAYSNSLKDGALTEALAKAGVTNPVLLKAAKALHTAAIEVADENGARVVKAAGKSLSDFVTEWAGSDEGKHFVTATESSGGGANNGHGSPPKPKGNSAGTKQERISRAKELLSQSED